jgi:tRNA-dihydrouridine synthase
MNLLLAPMEGLLDATLRDVLTRAGGISRCVSEFIRVTDTLLPERVFLRIMPELADGGCTPRVCRCAGSCWAPTRSAWPTTRPAWPASAPMGWT